MTTEWQHKTPDEKADHLKNVLDNFIGQYNWNVGRTNDEITALKAAIQEIRQKDPTPA